MMSNSVPQDLRPGRCDEAQGKGVRDGMIDGCVSHWTCWRPEIRFYHRLVVKVPPFFYQPYS